MAHLPRSGKTPLIRTDFSDDAVWAKLTAAISQPSEEGFLANVEAVDERDFDAADPERLGKLATNHAILFVADQVTMTHREHPLLCVDVASPVRRFRLVPSELWSAENNLSLANLDFEDFTGAVGGDGVFRGF
jgi:hypothetical protein